MYNYILILAERIQKCNASPYILILVIGVVACLIPININNSQIDIPNSNKFFHFDLSDVNNSVMISLFSVSSFFFHQLFDLASVKMIPNCGNCVNPILLLGNISTSMIILSILFNQWSDVANVVKCLINLHSVIIISSVFKYNDCLNDKLRWNKKCDSIICFCLIVAISLGGFHFLDGQYAFSIFLLIFIGIVAIIFVAQTIRQLSAQNNHNDANKSPPLVFPSIVCNIVIILFCTGWIIIKSISQFSRTDNDIFFDVPYLIHLNTLCSFIILMIQGRIIRSDAIYFKEALETKKAQSRTTVHELRTPLNTALLGLSLVSKEIMNADMSRDDIHEILSDIRDSTNIAINILNDFLTNDKIEEGILKVEKSPIKLWKFVKSVTKPFSMQAREAGIQLDFEETFFPHMNSLYVSGDEFKLGQVFRNLASNALKFTPHGGTVTISASKVLHMQQKPSFTTRKSLLEEVKAFGSRKSQNASVVPDQEYIRIQFKDTGVGISKENQCKLFKEIIQFSPGKLQGGKGSGLGMMITKGIVDGHNGFISVHSDGEGLGTTFTVDLPILPMDSSSQGVPSMSDRVGRKSRVSRLSRLTAQHSQKGFLLDSPPAERLKSMVRDEGIILSRCPSQSFRIKPPPPLERYGSSRILDEVWQLIHDFKFLIVDDARLNRKMLNRLLRDHCQSIIEAEDGEEAVHAIQSSMATGRPYDVVLMDYHMPKMEGPVAAKCMRAIGYEGIIIGVTGNAIQTEVDNYLANGADKVMIKPLDIEELKTVIAVLCKSTEDMDSIEDNEKEMELDDMTEVAPIGGYFSKI